MFCCLGLYSNVFGDLFFFLCNTHRCVQPKISSLTHTHTHTHTHDQCEYAEKGTVMVQHLCVFECSIAGEKRFSPVQAKRVN